MEPKDKHDDHSNPETEKKPGDECSADDYSENSLLNICAEVIVQELQRVARLEKEPNGFHLPDLGYTCHICHGSASGENSWYDQYGIKCMRCQSAVDRKEIPATVANKKDSYYTTYELKDHFGLFGKTLKELIKKKIIKVRTLKGEKYRPEVNLFLIKDNKAFLPPKKMVEDKKGSMVVDGQRYDTWTPWYALKNPLARLKKYKITEYLIITPADSPSKKSL
jgi:hypothetical protein